MMGFKLIITNFLSYNAFHVHALQPADTDLNMGTFTPNFIFLRLSG